MILWFINILRACCQRIADGHVVITMSRALFPTFPDCNMQATCRQRQQQQHNGLPSMRCSPTHGAYRLI